MVTNKHTFISLKPKTRGQASQGTALTSTELEHATFYLQFEQDLPTVWI